MNTLFLAIYLMGCGPKIAPGPIAVEEAEKPIRLITLPDATVPNVYFQITVATGAADDPLGKEGLASLTAKSLAEAGADDRTGQQVKQALYPTGNSIETVVDREWTTFRLTCHRDQAALCMDVIADVVLKPRFDSADVDRVRDAAEYAVGEGLLADEEALAFEALNAWLYEAHPYGHPVDGRTGVLPLLSHTAAQEFHKAHYVREAMVAGLAGNFDSEIQSAFEQRLLEAPAQRKPERALQRPLPVSGRSLLVIDTDTPVTGYMFGQPSQVDRNHPDWPALYLAFVALGEHRQSHGRLFREIRTARGLNYGDYAYIESYVQRGSSAMPEQGVLRQQPMTYFWLRPTGVENGAFTLKLALAELEDFAATGLTSAEFDDIRTYALRRLPLFARDPGRRLAFAIEAEASGTPNPLELLPETLPKLTVEQLNQAIAKNIRPSDLKIVAVSGEAESLVTQLLEEKPTPIVYADGIQPTAEQAARDSEVAARSIAVGASNAKTSPAEGIFR